MRSFQEEEAMALSVGANETLVTAHGRLWPLGGASQDLLHLRTHFLSFCGTSPVAVKTHFLQRSANAYLRDWPITGVAM
jgi:hypothetical protein